jgi:hypothetical protein
MCQIFLAEIFQMDELVFCLSIWKEHIPIGKRKYDGRIVLPIPSPSAGPASLKRPCIAEPYECMSIRTCATALPQSISQQV